MSAKSNTQLVRSSGELDLEALYALIATGPMLPVTGLRTGAQIVLELARVGVVECWRRTPTESKCLVAANDFGGIYNIPLPPLLARRQRAGWIETTEGLVLRLPPVLLDWADEAIWQLEGSHMATVEFSRASATVRRPTDKEKES